MGNNTVILLLNDQLFAIESDPEGFVKEMTYAMNRLGFADRQEEFHPGHSTVVSCAHADTVTILAVGGNCATVLGRVYNGGRHHSEADQESVLRSLADQHGFRLVRKPKRKSKA